MQKKIKLATFALCSSALALHSMQAMAAQAMTAAPDNGVKAAHANMLSVQQNKSIKGVVVDKDGTPIIGANIQAVGNGATQSTVTDMEGNFIIDVKPGTNLRISYIGFISATVKAKNKMQIKLQNDRSFDNSLMAGSLDENAFTFSEAQLGEDDDMSSNVTILNSSSNVYAKDAGYLFSPVRFRYRAFNQKYNDVYINGAAMNDMETGQFRFSNIGGLNRFSRNVDFALPFEANSYSMTGMAGSNNYDFRAGSMQEGQYASVAAANRNYTLRGLYTYSSGFNAKGWAITAGLTYRWANRGYVEGTYYNALSYFFGVQKKWMNGHSLSLSTWGNPTERSTQGASTDEAYWLANDYYYNPYWGYQNGHKRNSRVVNDFAPSAIATWDWDINEGMKLTTSLFGKYSMYKSTKLNYNNAENPQPDYWKNMPSANYYVWGDFQNGNNIYNWDSWNNAVNYWQASKQNRQIDWDRLYYSNQQAAKNGQETMYYLQAKHNDNLNLVLSSTLNTKLTNKSSLASGFMLGVNQNRHYQTMEDMLGGKIFHNINSYAIGEYSISDPRVQYDLNTAGPNNTGKLVYEGDKFGYDYRIDVQKAGAWSTYKTQISRFEAMVSGRIGYTGMKRKGYMRNGMAADNSYGNSGTAHFLDGGGKLSVNYDAGRGHAFRIGAGYEWRAPMANTAFIAPEINNDFVTNLKNERIFSSEVSYQYQNAWMHANLSGYYSRMENVTEWQNFYNDDENSFTYVSMTGLKKEYYGLEAGLKFKLTSWLDFKTLGTISEAKNINNVTANYMLSKSAEVYTDKAYVIDMRESGTPLTVGSIGLDLHTNGWFVNLNANYYDRIYLSYSPSYRYEKVLKNRQSAHKKYPEIFPSVVTEDGNSWLPEAVAQAKGHGGWMVDMSIGKSIRLKKGSLNFNLMITNLLNNQKLVTGGYEQNSRSGYTLDTSGEVKNVRVYQFSKNPKKYYAFGTNGMFQIGYRF